MELMIKACEMQKYKMVVLTETNEEFLKRELSNQKRLQIFKDCIKWSDLSRAFQEEIKKSCDVSEKICNKSMQHLLCDDILFDIIRNPTKVALTNTLPPPIPYYIGRKIVSRDVISAQQFCLLKGGKFVAMSKAEYSELEFLEMLGENERKEKEQKRYPVCISDVPGMGKSTLLAYVGRKLQNNKFVLYIEIWKYIQCLKSTASTPYSCKNVINAVCETISYDDMAEKLLWGLLKSKVDMEVMFDGLDTVPEDLEIMYHSFRMIRDAFPSVRLWVTTRPHVLNSLEKELGVFGYTLSPFDSNDQQNFLVKYWQNECVNCIPNVDNLKLFSAYCQETLTTFTEQMNDTLKVPFLCQLTAEFYKNEAVLCTTNKTGFNNCFPSLEYEPCAALFKHFISKMFDKYFTNFQMGSSEVTIEDLINAHISMSVSLLFPGRTYELKNYLNYNEILDTSEMLKAGLLQSTDLNASPKFINSAFAHYFVAEFTARLLRRDQSGFASVSFLMEEILKSETINIEIFSNNPDYIHTKIVARFCHATICYFFDNIIDVNLKIENLVEVLGSKKHLVEQTALACVYHDCFNVFRLLNKTNAFRLFKNDIYKPSSLFVLVGYSRLSFIDYFLKKFTRVSGIDLQTVVLYDDPVDLNLLHIAAHKGRFKVFEYLLNRQIFLDWLKNSAKNLLIHLCVAFSDGDDDKLVNEKLQIIKAIHKVRKDIFEESDHEGRNGISCKKINASILKECKKLSDTS